MKRSWCSFSTFALVLACGGDGDGQLSRDDAAALVIEELVTAGDPIVVLGASEPLSAGDRIVAYHSHPELAAEVAIEADADAWFFWLDDQPGALFDHPSRYAMVDRESGEITTIDARWWPTRDGAAVWDDAAYASEPDRVYADLGDGMESRAGLAPELRPIADCVANGGHGVVINGWGAGQSLRKDLDDDGANMKEALTDAGLDTTYFGPADSEGVDQTMTPATLENYFAQKATELGPGDTLVVYVEGHGWVSEEARPGETQIGEVWEKDLEKWLAAFDPGVNVVVMIEGCHSGGMLDSLTCVADLAVSATDEKNSSYGDLDADDSNPQDNGTEWTSSMLTCWNTLMESGTSRADVGGRAQAAGANFFAQLIGECFDGAHEIDEAERRGLTHPQKQVGAAKAAIPQEDPMAPVCDPVEPVCTDDQLECAGVLGGYIDGGEFCHDMQPLEIGNETQPTFEAPPGTAEGNVDGRMLYFDGNGVLVDPLVCGARTICDNQKTAPNPDDAFVAGMWLDGQIDEVPQHYYQYAFVFDQDGDASNNYQAAEPYPYDFFDDTDLWIQLMGVPGQPWTLEVIDARDGGLVSLQTEAAVVIDGDMMLAILPMDLVGQASDMRFTAFRHEGDYGMEMPWSGDVMPPIDEPKIPISE